MRKNQAIKDAKKQPDTEFTEMEGLLKRRNYQDANPAEEEKEFSKLPISNYLGDSDNDMSDDDLEID